MDEQLEALKQIVKSIQYLVNQSKLETTKIYSGFVLSNEGGGKYKVKVNDIEKVLPLYGTGTVAVHSSIKVFVPQGNYNLAFLIAPFSGSSTTTPNPGVLSYNGRTGNVVAQANDYNYQQIAGLADQIATFIHTQNTPSVSWVINHNLNKYPSVQIVDNNNNIILADIVYNNNNSLTVTFDEPLSGVAYLN